MDAPEQSPITELRIIAARVKVHVVGDPGRRDIAIEGPHSLEVDGGRAVVRSDPPADEFFDEADGAFTRRVRFRLGDWMLTRARDWRPDLVVHIDSTTSVDATIALGGVEVEHMSGAVRCQVARGAAWLRGVQGPVDAVVSTGRLLVRGDLMRGQSTVSCHHGEALVELTPGADVRVVALADRGKAEVEGGSWDGGGWVFGTGAAGLTLDLDSGSVSVCAVPDDLTDPTPAS
jgi:hypothetical protein